MHKLFSPAWRIKCKSSVFNFKTIAAVIHDDQGNSAGTNRSEKCSGTDMQADPNTKINVNALKLRTYKMTRNDKQEIRNKTDLNCRILCLTKRRHKMIG